MKKLATLIVLFGLILLVTQPAKPQNIIMSVAGAHFKGDKTAKVTLIEFSDFQ